MAFISSEFVIFLFIIVCFLFFIRNVNAQNIILLIASYIFYARCDWKFLFLIIIETLIIYFLSIRISRTQIYKTKKLLLVLGIIILLLILGFFKYYNFFIESVLSLFYTSRVDALNILLPLGISFYTFQGLSMLIDVYTGKIQAEKDFVKVALCIAFFPQITSGPIVQANRLLPQLHVTHHITYRNLEDGLQIIMYGLLKKKVIADRLALAVNAVYETPKAYSGVSLLFTVLTYSIQIYCDFSGYSDIVIGIGRILGFNLGQNFNLPYLAKNTSEFWRRWHISLSTWFRDYVYIPLGGSRNEKFRTYLNLFITMILSGLWHGAGWKYIFWGGMYGICNIIHKVYSDIRKKIFKCTENNSSIIVSFISTCVNFTVVSFLWIFFRANDFKAAWLIIYRIFTFAPGVTYIYTYTIIFGFMLLVIELITYYTNQGNDKYHILSTSKFVNKVFICIIICIILCFSYVGNNAFIYAQY